MGTRYEEGDVVYYMAVRWEVINVENPDSSSPDYVIRELDEGHERTAKASDLKMADDQDIPEDEYQIVVKIGKPVKAGKYYSSAEGRFKRDKYGNSTYAIGQKKNGKIQHTSDVREVQAYSSDATFIYSDPQLHYTKLEQIMSEVGVVGDDRYERIWVYHGGRTKALKLDQFDTVKRLKILADNAEEAGYHVEYYPDIDPSSVQFFVKESQLED